MKLPTLALALLALLPGLSLAAPPPAPTARELRIAALPPATPAASDSESGSVTALNDALVRELCQRLAVRCEVTRMPFAEIIPGVESGRYQLGVANVLRTPEREERVLFTQMLWRSSSRLVGRPQTVERHGGPALQVAQLSGVTIAAERGTQQYRYLSRISEKQGIKLLETTAVADAMRATLDGRADFALMPVRSAYFLLQQQPGQVTFAGQAMMQDGLGGTVHMILPKGSDALRQEVDAVIDAMRRDGTFQRILRRHMPFLAD
jgi:ABC-type amino acid transport substrate-binding protein